MDNRAKVQWLVMLAAAVGCSSEPAMMVTPPPQQPGVVVVRMDPASAADCPFGGTIVSSGLDDNHNGQLDDAEIKTRTAVCSPMPALPAPPAPPVVVRLVPEPASGGHCAEGGTAVESGPDTNGNGVLDDAEVAHTDFVCGVAVVTKLTAVAPGNQCAAGGVAFTAGPDRNGNGVLDDAEVESTEISCGDRVEHDVIIRSLTDVNALKDVRVITGQVAVTQTGDFTLPKLAQIGGALQINTGSTGAISLPALQTISGALFVGNNQVTAISCPQLTHVGSLTLGGSMLHDLSGFPALTEIAGNVEISGLPALVSAVMPSVTVSGNLSIGGNGNLTTIDWTVQDKIGNVSVGSNAPVSSFHLTVVPLNAASGVAGDIAVSSISSVQLSAFEVKSISLTGQPHDLTFNIGRVDQDLMISANTTPFDLTLSDAMHKGHLDVSGNIQITGPLASVHSTDGLTVFGNLILSGTQLQQLAPTGQIRVFGAMELLNNPLLSLVAPTEVDGSLVVTGNAELPSLSFAQFGLPGEVLGDVVVSGNPVLASAPSLGSLVHVHGGVSLASNPLLGNPFGPQLTQIDHDLSINDMGAMTDLSLANLAQLGGNLFVTNNASIKTISIPALTAVPNQLLITSNPLLHHLAFDALVHTTTFQVNSNPQLPTCEVLALFAIVDGDHGQTGNDDTAVCGP